MVGLVLVLTVAIGAFVVVARTTQSEPRVQRSSAGGFAVTLPAGWVATVKEGRPTSWLSAERPIRPVGPATAWMWVNRFPRGDTSLADRSAAMQKEFAGRNGRVIETTVGGRAALRVSFDDPARRIGFLPAPTWPTVIYETPVGSHVYHLGIGGWPSFPEDDAAAIVASFDIFEPRGFRRVVVKGLDATVRLPADWDLVDDEQSGASLSANDGRVPTGAWLYIWNSKHASVADAVANARTNITAAGGRDLVESTATVDGLPAVRLDFAFPNTAPGMPPMATDVEWFVDRSRRGGGIAIVGIGRNDPTSSIADELIANFRLQRRK